MRAMIIFMLLLVASPVVAERPRPSVERPNIIWIMADDLGYGDLGCYGQREIQTPRIDRMAREGRRYTQCYAGSTVCAPTRSVLMTGQHTGRTTIRGNSALKPRGARVPLRPEDVTVAEVLAQAGYATGVTGKWGLGEADTSGIPNRQGFDRWLGFLNQRRAHHYFVDYLWRDTRKLWTKDIPGGREQRWAHRLMTQFAMDFINEHHERPFFLYVAYTVPHGHYEIPSDAPYSDRPWPQDLRNYAAMITRMDADVGRMLDLLAKLEIDRRTLVVFTSDNGPEEHYFRHSGTVAEYRRVFNSNGPLRGIKRDLTDGGIRVPAVARWPGQIPPGTESDHVWAFWDLMPTAAELAGVDPPAACDGISIVPSLLGHDDRQPRHEYLYWEFYERGFQQAVRTGPWKALRLKWGQAIELYNIVDDPAEQHNLAADHPDVVTRCQRIMREAHEPSDHWPSPADR